jgi:hypothetical protein
MWLDTEFVWFGLGALSMLGLLTAWAYAQARGKLK